MHSKWGPKPAHLHNLAEINSPVSKKGAHKKEKSWGMNAANIGGSLCKYFMLIQSMFLRFFFHILERTRFDNHYNLCKRRSFYRHEFIWFASLIMSARNITNNLLSTNFDFDYHLVNLSWWYSFPTFNAQLTRQRDFQYKKLQMEQASHCKPSGSNLNQINRCNRCQTDS